VQRADVPVEGDCHEHAGWGAELIKAYAPGGKERRSARGNETILEGHFHQGSWMNARHGEIRCHAIMQR
jgi:hypothetical protein